MFTLLVKWLICAFVVILVGNFLPGIHVADFKTALLFAAVLGVLHVTLRPVLSLLSLPITFLTLGLFSFVVNGFTFWLAAIFVDGFRVDSFLWAMLAAFLVSILSSILDRIIAPGARTIERIAD
jgi:putative membrane protein